MAIEDAVVLADVLRRATGVEMGLGTYVERRRARTSKLMKMARASTNARTAGPLSARLREVTMPWIFPRMYPRATGWLYRDLGFGTVWEEAALRLVADRPISARWPCWR